MNWSATEITALAGKAARGAGAPAQQAARFGQAAATHLMAGRSPDALSAALGLLPAGPILAYPLVLDDALLCARARGSAAVLSVARDDLLDSYIETLPFAAQAQTAADGTWALTLDFAKPRPRHPAHRISGCDALVSEMAALAARTFVPESESSRRAGAGAGLTDND